ncbi:MAG: cytochrome c biogenesis heme-transporting ATPase CcmA [Betaproteobacteria bacterium]
MSTPQGAPVLHGRDLRCERGNRSIFSGLAFGLARGGLLEVRGPNGSGKTSLLRMVCGFLQPAAGRIEWDGQPVGSLGEEFRAHLAYVGHLNGIKEELVPAENLAFAARLAGLPADPGEIASALRAFSLPAASRLPCRYLSQGQKRRLALARLGLSKSRDLWVLDEPFAALDAQGIDVVRSMLEQHLSGGGMVMLTTHQEVPIRGAAIQRIEFGA